MRHGYYLVSNNIWENSTPVKLKKFYYAGLFPDRRRRKINEKVLFNVVKGYHYWVRIENLPAVLGFPPNGDRFCLFVSNYRVSVEISRSC